MLQTLPRVKAELIVKEYTTQGSGPLLVLADDGKSYVAKTTTYPVPCNELINEVLCGYFARCWGLAAPPMSLLSISKRLAGSYQKEKQSFGERYARCDFDNSLFFGSQVINCPIEFDEHFKGPSTKASMKQWNNPIDIIKIGIFDLWVGNFDRKPENPNILLADRGDGSFDFCPIDHTAAFGHLSKYREVRDVMLHMDSKKSILSHPFVKQIAKFVPPNEKETLLASVLDGMNVVLEHLDFIYEQVPTDWGFSKKSRSHLSHFLADKDRNQRIASSYLSYF